jgi:low affinity Fe/Cu permease
MKDAIKIQAKIDELIEDVKYLLDRRAAALALAKKHMKTAKNFRQRAVRKEQRIKILKKEFEKLTGDHSSVKSEAGI